MRNNIIITKAEDLSPMYMVDAPGLFDIPFFVSTNLVYYREGVPQFYQMGEAPGGRAQQGQEVQAIQLDQAQRLRQENLERAATELAEENRKSRAEMAKLTALMESILKELARGKASIGAGTSGHGGQEEEPTGPRKKKAMDNRRMMTTNPDLLKKNQRTHLHRPLRQGGAGGTSDRPSQTDQSVFFLIFLSFSFSSVFLLLLNR